MSNTKNKQDVQIDAALYEVLRELASWPVALHMDTERSEPLMGGFKEYLLGHRRPFSHTRDKSASKPARFRIPRVMSGYGSREELDTKTSYRPIMTREDMPGVLKEIKYCSFWIGAAYMQKKGGPPSGRKSSCASAGSSTMRGILNSCLFSSRR